ncbi:MAG: hypothetical protein E4H40_04740 [Candidatus Brocadiia bacterium]|nr:MAG: hypothetical protein E4H40_04740 [Candidatus Brocadiia bacterium]
MGVNLSTAYNNLYVLLDAGVPLLRSLDNIIEGTTGHVRQGFEFLKKGAVQGTPLAKSMSDYSRVFGYMDVVVVEAAEMSGSLPEALKLLGDWHEFCRSMKRIILSGLALPILILHVAALIIPVPGLAMGGDWSLRVYLMGMLSVLMPFYIAGGAVLFIVKFLPERGIIRRALDGFVLRIPVLGQAVLNLAMTRYCRSFYMMYKARVPIVTSLEKAAAVTGNATVSKMFAGGADAAKRGEDASQGFSRKLPRDFIEMWRTGEEAGSLDLMTKKLGDNYAFTAELLLKSLAAWTPKIVYLFVCIRMLMAMFGLAHEIYGSYTNF